MFKNQTNRAIALLIVLTFIAILVLVDICDNRTAMKELLKTKEEIILLKEEIAGLKTTDDTDSDKTIELPANTIEAYIKEEPIVEPVIEDEEEDSSDDEVVNLDEDDTDTTNNIVPKYKSISIHSDIAADTVPDVHELDMLIDYWDTKIENGTPFKGCGWAFRRAYEYTGIDPIVILSIAAWESGWGTSEIAKDKFNFYGIGAFDGTAYESALIMGSNVEDGIVNGAIWIYENYYSMGKNTLSKISNGYSTTSGWDSTILNELINPNYRILDDLINRRIIL